MHMLAIMLYRSCLEPLGVMCEGETGTSLDNNPLGPLLLFWLIAESRLLKKGAMAKIYTGGMREREMLKNFILSQRAEKTHYFCSETTTYISSRKEIKGNNMESKRSQVRTKFHIWSID